MKMIIKNGKVITGNKIINDAGIVINEDKIEKIFQKGELLHAGTSGLGIDVQGCYISPGFVDIHTHGGGNHDFMDGTVESFTEGCRAHLEHGTTFIVPTTSACALSELLKIIEIFKEARRAKKYPHMPWLHLEGPYLSRQQAGAQDTAYIKNPDKKEYLKILKHKDLIIRWTIAPELPQAMELGDELKKNKILPCIGHSDADYEVVLEAFKHGYSHITHFYSCCSTIKRIDGYRYAGIIESAYLLDEMTLEIIADGRHLPPSLIELVYKLKGPDRVCLVTDSMRAAATLQKTSIFGNLTRGKKVIIEDDVAKMPGRKKFAGSVATADKMIRNILESTTIPIVDAVKMMSITPARIIGISNKKGSIEEGKDADIIVFNDNIDIKMVIAGGEIVLDRLNILNWLKSKP